MSMTSIHHVPKASSASLADAFGSMRHYRDYRGAIGAS